ASSKRPKNDSWIVKAPVPGGPVDGSVIPSFLGHVASRIWIGQSRGMLKCQNRMGAHKELREWLREMAQAPRDLILQTGLSHLASSMHTHVDTPLISAFVERWQPDTNSFHLPFGEMSIMLHDVRAILGVSLDGAVVTGDPDSLTSQAHCMEILGVDQGNLMANLWDHGSVTNAAIFEALRKNGAGRSAEHVAIGWLWILLATTLFTDKSGNRVSPKLLHEMIDDVQGVETYSWGSAALAYLFRQLGIASRGDAQGLSGCLTLMQSWIYEYFPTFRPQKARMTSEPNCVARSDLWSTPVPERSDKRLKDFRRQLDRLTAAQVNWLPYDRKPHELEPRTLYSGCLRYRDIVEPYMPLRCLRQLGYVQIIPPCMDRPTNACRAWESRMYRVEHAVTTAVDHWDQFPRLHSIHLSDFTPTTVDDLGKAHEEYRRWYDRVSHPILLPDSQPDNDAVPARANTDY
ncbi:Aminotransferase-like- plant mobile domain family protein, partial [Striga hermonthica]